MVQSSGKANNMKKLKICVYAICKNESKFVDRFMDAVEEADGVYILDTGSEDNTVELFKNRGAVVHKKVYDTFEFDKARNDSLRYVPKDVDICICLDIDEVIEKGFTKVIREKWKDDTKQIRYDHIINYDENDNPTSVLRNVKIHSRNDFVWEYPIHEVLKYTGKGKCNIVDDYTIKVWHKPDNDKSREFYLEILERYVKEHPESARNRYLLTRTLLNRKKYYECIKSGHLYLDANYKNDSLDHKSKVMIYMSKSYAKLNMYEESILWGENAINTFPDTRDVYTSLMETYYNCNDYDNTIRCGEEALKIDKSDNNILNSPKSWNGTIEIYLSSAYYYKKDYKKAVKYIEDAIGYHPKDKNLLEKKELYKKKMYGEEE